MKRKRKTLEKKFVKCLNIWLSHPITKRNVFSLLSFLFGEEEKMTTIIDSGKLKFICSPFFFLVNEQNVIWVANMKPCFLLFQSGEKILSFPHNPSVTLHHFFIPHPFLIPLFSQYGILYVTTAPPTPTPRGGPNAHPPFSILYCFSNLFLSIMQETKWLPCLMTVAPLTPLLPSPSPYWLCPGFSSFSIPKHTPPPPCITLFFLNVIVKCSSEMTLNMCILSEGNTLGYILLTSLVSRGLFSVCVWSLVNHRAWKLTLFFPSTSKHHY